MKHDMIRIELEKQLNEELYDQFEGDIIQELIREAKIEPDKDYLRASLEGHGFKISDKISPGLYKLCMNVQKKLKFKEKIDYYVVNNSDVNAFTRYKIEDERNHIVVLNSGILKMMDDDELKFIIGHEIGHLISRYSELYGIIEFIFPDYNRMPVIFKNKIELTGRLAELTSDRYGFIASGNLNKCLSNFFKLSSGLDPDRISFNPGSYLKEVEQTLEAMEKDPFDSGFSHPDNQIRIKAIELFSRSDTYKAIKNNKKLKEDKKLNDAIDALLELTFIKGSSALDSYRTDFIISGGYIIAAADTKVTNIEVEMITNILSSYTFFPEIKLKAMINSKQDISDIFHNSITSIMESNPAERFEMFNYLITIAIVDKKFEREELSLLKNIGEKVFGLSKKEVAQMIAGVIGREFIPMILK